MNTEADGQEIVNGPKMISIPDRLFSDFKIVDSDNEQLFEFVAYSMIV